MKLSVSAYRAHASAHKKILDTAYQLNYGSTSASHHATTSSNAPTCTPFQIDPPSSGAAATSTQKDNGKSSETGGGCGIGLGGLSVGTAGDDISSDDARTSIQSPRSQNTSREEDESSNANESDTKSPGQRTKSNQRWMKLRTTVQISSAMQKKPPLKREDSFLQRFSTRQIPETQETVEDTGSEGCSGDAQSAARRRRRTRKQPRTVVNPDENFYFYWLLVLTVCILYNLWTLIVRQSFPELQLLVSNFWLACDSLSDIIFILDVCVQLRTGYLEQGLMVYDSKKLAKHYLTSRAFLLDLAALCPLDLLQLRFGPQPLLRWPRFFKVYRAVNYYYMVESRTVYPNLWRVVNLIHILLILAHWFGCFYFLLSEAEGFQGDWVYPYRPGDYATLTRKYLGSLYWSTLTLTTIGDLPTPETNAERTNSVDGPRSLPRRGVKSRLLQFNNNGGYIFTIVSYLIGVFIFATIVGQVGNVITNRNANRLEFERLLDGAKTYMRHHKVPGGMKRRVLRWYDYSWSRGRIQGGGDINTALGLLPDKLKTELALHVNLSVLKKVTIFQECQPEFLRDLVLKMKAYIFTPGDSICRKGEVAREMFIIADGILEVLSETGKVLTSMKAGDFFGEIGILNLDGLNKRTADVRSVGYSELFSLSREDVLAAMKDYPEAQEILQALGRKRLMEVKASARQHAKDSKDQHAVDPRGIVGKIKNEAKGLRNALRKSRTHRRSQESLELQPLHISSGHEGKGMLKRMPRVKSHDLSQEECQGTIGQSDQQSGETVTSPLGAGLPLLARLRLLKERQEREEHQRTNNNNSITATSPAVLSSSPSSVKSPPPTQEQPEVAGGNVPLLQRILMLKNKEERSGTASAVNTNNLPCSQPTSPTCVTAITSTRASFSGPSLPTSSKGFAVAKSLLGVGQSKSKMSFRERLKLHKECSGSGGTTNTNNNGVNSVTKEKEQQQHQYQQQEEIVPNKDDEKQIVLVPSKECESSDGKTEPPWSKLKKAAIVRENAVTDVIDATTQIASSSAGESSASKSKPTLTLITRKTKIYRSIDDLSPEYGGLPFVKKLKILNERQKLEELETVMKTRSFSLDIPDTQPSIDVDSLTRSQSEGSAMHQDKNLLTANLEETSSLNSSSESNETMERKHLKSILKKLTESTTDPELLALMPNRFDTAELKKLMGAPTIEGYASPPHSANVLTGGNDGGGSGNLFSYPVVNSPPATNNDDSSNNRNNKINNGDHNQFHHPPISINHQESNRRQDLEKCGIQFISAKANHQMKFIKNTLEDDQYFGDILVAIKQVMSAHMQEVQETFQNRFEKLEDEIRKRDELIKQLKSHIIDLERAAEESLTDSVETIVPLREQHSWEERNRRESQELRELPQQTLQPQAIWPSRRSGNVVVDIDSATDTESDIGDSSETGEEPEYENSSHNWEIELLAAQIRDKRSASLDPSAGRPIRKRFNRAGSVDQNKKE